MLCVTIAGAFLFRTEGFKKKITENIVKTKMIFSFNINLDCPKWITTLQSKNELINKIYDENKYSDCKLVLIQVKHLKELVRKGFFPLVVLLLTQSCLFFQQQILFSLFILYIRNCIIIC